MSHIKPLSLLLILLVLNASCYTPSTVKQVGFASVNNNVCKTLSGKVVLYAIFVDSKYTNPWSNYDIESTLDSIEKAVGWIEKKAIEDSIRLDISIDFHKTSQGRIPVKSDLPKKTLSATLYKKPLWSGIKDIYRWADKIAAEAGKSLPKDTSITTNIKNDLKTRERLIARLRDIHRTDKVVLMYFINNYYKDEFSVTFDISNDNNVEFSVVSFKNPAVIAHEFLHIFGAYDLYITPFDIKNKDKKKKDKLMQMFPNEIMAFTYREINKLNISDFSKYLIGWKKELPVEYQKLLLDKGYFAVKY
jgi:hypothetical protein